MAEVQMTLKRVFHKGFLSFEVPREPELKNALVTVLSACQKKYNDYVQVTIKPPYKPRTLKENAKYWAMCTEFARHCGMTSEDVSMGVKYRAMEEGLWKSEAVPFSKNGEVRPVSTTKSNTSEMAILIEVLYRIAAEDGYIFKDQ